MIIDIPLNLIKLEDDSYHILVEASFNSQFSGNLIIDTGASKTVLDQEFASLFVSNLSTIDDAQSSGINAMITETQIGTISSFKIGAFEIKNYSCILMNLSHINDLYLKVANMKIAGLIGSDFLVDYEAVINYHQKKLTLNY